MGHASAADWNLLTRRDWLRAGLLQTAAVAGASWLSPVSHLLAQQADQLPAEQAQSVILIWLGGGASQLETFDPHPGTEIAGGGTARKTSAKGIELATACEQLAEQMHLATIVRSVSSPEGDHERGTYALKTGFKPDPTVVHPSIGAIVCHELPRQAPGVDHPTEIPRHISLLPGAWPGKGGLLGNQYDAFKSHDPSQKVPDVRANVGEEQYAKRLKDLEVVESAFAAGRLRMAQQTRHRDTVAEARQMMTSEQLKAFEIDHEPAVLRAAYGNTSFGRACLAARRLTEVGVRCVEVTLDGWDSHADNHRIQREQVKVLDPALATLINDLHQRDRLKQTLVVCLSEFGRTPRLNRLEGRDHWPHGFSVLLAGGRFRRGYVHGGTDPAGGKEVTQEVKIGALHATLLTALGIDPHKENISPAQRPIRLAEGEAVRELLQVG